MINKKQRAKLRKKLKELGVDEFRIYPCRDGYALNLYGLDMVMKFEVEKSGLTKKVLEGILNGIKKKLGES